MRAGLAADKLFFAAIYTAVAVLVVLSARGMIHHARDAAFYRDYLALWESGLTELRQRQPDWPAVTLDDPAAYMAALVDLMRGQGIVVPRGNTDSPYIYRLSRFGKAPRNLLLLGTTRQMRLFNVPEQTMRRLDRIIDGQADPDKGRWTAAPSADGMTWNIQWRY
ncbi:hypothetical protein [Desulfatitalea alkaliphila]|uniref:Uncharacterized protein n=1 Tax=Desulfatitalea alkaliphila TaxID=2929485 RepID=A0AA41UM12_9BACT|nr:hypothetical protein [Desulfatitalea alkaliphila]MCJ8502141.1 hypothetical protein [Desulfatitalea alkaliphila]